MSRLKANVKAMEQTREQTDPLGELRRWRLAAQQRYMNRVVRAAKGQPKEPRK